MFKTRSSKALFYALSPVWFSPIAFGVMYIEGATSPGGYESVGRGWATAALLMIVVAVLLLMSLFYLVMVFLKDRPILEKTEKLKIRSTLLIFGIYSFGLLILF